MSPRAFTGFGAGRTAEDAFAGAKVPPGVGAVFEVAVPEGENPSKVATFIQRFALDPSSISDVPPELRSTVEAAGAQLAGSPGVALGISMAGTPPGEKMLARLAPGDPQAEPWLIFGLDRSEDQP